MFKTSLAITLLLAASPALAQSNANPVTARVQIADLNLSSTAGVAELDRRIDAAVKTVCSDNYARELWLKFAVKTCRIKAVDGATRQRNIFIARARDERSIQTAAR